MTRRPSLFSLIACVAVCFSQAVRGEESSSEGAVESVTQADTVFASTAERLRLKPIVDLRYRYEHVSNDAFIENANAHTFRARLGVEIEPFENLKFLVEGEGVANLNDEFNSTTNGQITHPVVADPEALELNRAQLTYSGLANTEFTLGRQKIAIGNQRFIGAVDFRQNQQTFDAVSLSTAPLNGLSLRYHYIGRVHRIFGDDHPAGEFKGDTHAVGVGYKMNESGAISAYAFLVDLDEAPALSSATWGARAAQSLPISADKGTTITVTGEYARQRDYRDNPADYSVGYAHATVSVKSSGWLAKAGYERLGGNGVSSFTTPLATLHKFQGFADAFLATPGVGIEDTYLVLGVSRKDVFGVKSVSLKALAHDFEAARGGDDYGREIDFQVIAKLTKNLNAELKTAVFDGGDFGPADRTLTWASLRFSY